MVATLFVCLFQFYVRCGSKGGNFDDYGDPSMMRCKMTCKGNGKGVERGRGTTGGSGDEARGLFPAVPPKGVRLR
jgi:hypothetical protein